MTIRRLLRSIARSIPPVRDLHDFAMQAEAGRIAAVGEANGLRGELAAARAAAQDVGLTSQEKDQCAKFMYLKERRRLIELDFPVTPKVRYGYGKPSEPLISAKLEACAPHFEVQMRRLLPLLQPMLTIPRDEVENVGEPNWVNLAFPALDAMALYGLIASRQPKRLIEIGSGFSTKFARRAILDHSLSTKIISIDPEPRAEVDAICDEVIRLPLEDVPVGFFESITEDDLIFFDGSHRSFQNSDVTVFFTEILPRLPSGLMLGIHDIFLPDDYPPPWLEWYFSEQYLLACWLLAGDRLRPEFASYFIGETQDLHSIFDSMWKHPALAGANHKGGAFFATIT